MHTYICFHMPNASIHASTSVKALFMMGKPSWNSWLACNVLTAYCRLHRGLGWHLTFPAVHMWAERDPAAINFEMKRLWSCHRVEKIHANSCAFTVEFSFFLFLILHPFWKITIKCDAPDSNILLLFSLHLPYLSFLQSCPVLLNKWR